MIISLLYYKLYTYSALVQRFELAPSDRFKIRCICLVYFSLIVFDQPRDTYIFQSRIVKYISLIRQRIQINMRIPDMVYDMIPENINKYAYNQKKLLSNEDVKF